VRGKKNELIDSKKKNEITSNSLSF